MQIRTKLTLIFVFIVAIILLVASFAIYFFSSDYRQGEFYERLLSKASTNARLLIEIEEVDERLLQLIESNNSGTLPQEKIIIYNYNNEKLYSSNDADDFIITRDLLDQVRLERDVRWTQGDYEMLGILFEGEYDRFVVIAGAVDRYGLSKLRNLRNILIIVTGVSLLIVLVSGWIFSGRVLKPINEIVTKVKKISANNLNERIDTGNQRDEIAQLALTFNKMLDRLELAFKMQKNFVANASHELRTPLTAITGQIEVVLLKNRSTNEYQETLRSLLEDIKNMNKLSNRLLMLAQATSGVLEANFSQVRVDDILWQARSELIRSHPDYNINIHFEETPEVEDRLIVKGNEQLLQSAIKNLMENGCKFSPDHQVEVNIAFSDHDITLQFVDKGIGIDPLDMPYIFEPFYRSRYTSSFNGHGIGLSIVERIVKIHNGRLTVKSTKDEGSVFHVNIPN